MLEMNKDFIEYMKDKDIRLVDEQKGRYRWAVMDGYGHNFYSDKPILNEYKQYIREQKIKKILKWKAKRKKTKQPLK